MLKSKLWVFLLLILVMISCSKTKEEQKDIFDIRIGMKQEEVVLMLGKPDLIAKESKMRYIDQKYVYQKEGIIYFEENEVLRIITLNPPSVISHIIRQ